MCLLDRIERAVLAAQIAQLVLVAGALSGRRTAIRVDFEWIEMAAERRIRAHPIRFVERRLKGKLVHVIEGASTDQVVQFDRNLSRIERMSLHESKMTSNRIHVEMGANIATDESIDSSTGQDFICIVLFVNGHEQRSAAVHIAER